MDHLQARDLLNSYLDGDLPADVSVQVTQHVELCPECRAELADLRRLTAWLRAMSEVEPPRSFVLTRGQSEMPGWLRTVRYATAVAAILLIGLLVGDRINASPSSAPRQVLSSAAVTATPTAAAGAPFPEPRPAPTVAGALAVQDPNAPFEIPRRDEPPPPSGIRLAEIVVAAALIGLAATWLVGWLAQQSRFRLR